MFEVDQAILAWRRQMLAAGIKTPAPLDELESHLREEIARQMESGLNPREAFDLAVQKIGRAQALNKEFEKVGAMKADPWARWHYPLLLLVWNTTAGSYFLPGKPTLCLTIVLVSFSLSMLAFFIKPDFKFISVPSVAWPLLFITAVLLGTALLTSGIGHHVTDSQTRGGGPYLPLFAAVLGYFALVAQPIPPHKAGLYVKLFFLGSLIAPAIYFVFYLSPVDMDSASSTGFFPGVAFLNGIAPASIALIALLLARHGLRGVLAPKKYWRILAFTLLIVLSLFGGYRTLVLELALFCAVMFCLEGLFRTRLLPAVILAAVLAAFVVVPFAGKLPHPIQRSLSFLPIHLDNEDANSARAITHWRVVVWKNLWSQVPHHLVLGKGLGTDAHAREKWAYGINQVSDMAALADVLGDVHNGPISLLLPFGLPGVIGFVWFLVAGGRVLYRNYKLGDPAFAQINRCLYALFITKTVMFLFIFGAFYSDLACFVGFVGLSIALNGGARNPAGEPAAPRSILLNNLKLASG